MKTLKMICSTAILTLALSTSSLGGEINTPGLTGETVPGVTRPVPETEETPMPEVPGEPGDGSAGLTAILLAIAALF